MASAWDNGPQPTSASAASDAVDHAWWKTLGDPAVDALVEAALVDNPTLRQAIARMDQARATARVSDAQRLPQISEIGRAHVRTPVTHAHLVCRLLLAKKKNTHTLPQQRNTQLPKTH